MELVEQGRSCRHDYIRALEEERKKIEVFQRELPLCLQLVTRAIASERQQLCDEDMMVDNSGVVLEEFIPFKPSQSSSVDRAEAVDVQFDSRPDWFRSVQLRNRETDKDPKKDPPKKPIAVCLNKIGGAFQPFDRLKHAAPPPAAPAAAVSSITSGGGSGDGSGSSSSTGGKDKDREGQSQPHRKTRRCWSPELHRRFLHALEQLGGSHVATPKQIREMMKIDGVTSDEVKSHLQKFRLHTRRPSPAAQSSNITPAPPQIVLIGGILLPPPNYAAAVATVAQPAVVTPAAPAPLSGIYAPVASHPPSSGYAKRQQTSKEPRGPNSAEEHSVGDEGDASDSASLSTSVTSQTTTASPPCDFAPCIPL